MRLLKLTLLLVLCACTHSVYAQRHYVGISALEVNYGLNIFGRNNTNLNLSVSKYRSRTTYWKIGLNYFEKSYNYSYESNTTEVPTIVSFSSTAKDYYIDAAYFKTVATNLSSLYFSLGLGLFTGVEAYKKQDDKYDFLLGLKIEPELEYFVSPRVANLLGETKEAQESFSHQESGTGSMTESLQKEKVVKAREVAGQSVGHFIGKVAGGKPPYFNTQFNMCKFIDKDIPAFSKPVNLGDGKEELEYDIMEEIVSQHYLSIISKVNAILEDVKNKTETDNKNKEKNMPKDHNHKAWKE